jgi:hypothetical protein
MSQTTETSSMIFHHNGDFSGDVSFGITADAKTDSGQYRVHRNSGGMIPVDYTIRIPFEDLKELFATYLKQRLIASIEDMDTDDFIAEYLDL